MRILNCNTQDDNENRLPWSKLVIRIPIPTCKVVTKTQINDEIKLSKQYSLIEDVGSAKKGLEDKTIKAKIRQE